MPRYFITSSGTDIGKTFVTCGLVKAARVAGQTVRAVKPIASGFDRQAMAGNDTAYLLEAMGQPATDDEIQRCSPWRFAAPLSPDMAAAKEGKSIDFTALVDWSKEALAGPEQHVLVEGVGGVMVPLNNDRTVLDWIEALEIPAVLVVGTYLGTISHTLTALEVLRVRKIAVSALVISETPESTVSMSDTAEAIRRFADSEIILLPRVSDAEKAGDRLKGLFP